MNFHPRAFKTRSCREKSMVKWPTRAPKAILGPGQVAVENDFVGIANDIVGAEKECALFL